MFSKTLPAQRPSVIALLAIVCTVGGSAQRGQEKPPQGKDVPGETLTADLVKTGLFLIAGGGGNTLLRFSASGLILVDGKLPGNYRALMSQVRRISKISDLPVRALILTDHHEEHAGNNREFSAAKVGIIAQQNVTRNLMASKSPPGKDALPAVTYDHDYTVKLGGVEVRLMHFGSAHTNGDTVVYFPNLKVVAVGDLFAATPDPDFAAGGSLVNWGPVLAQILNLDFDVVVPSRGPTVTRADLEAFKGKIDTLVSRATELVRKGVPRSQLMAQLKTDDLGWRFAFAGERLDRFYAELSRTR
jgi:glyoxylase-like metal-dependent hydrolase (beta-lactamase superfamily II)